MKLYSAIYDTGGFLFEKKTDPELFALIPGGAKELSSRKHGQSRFKLTNGRTITVYENQNKNITSVSGGDKRNSGS